MLFLMGQPIFLPSFLLCGCFLWYILHWFKASENTFHLLPNNRRVNISASTAKSRIVFRFPEGCQDISVTTQINKVVRANQFSGEPHSFT